MVADAVIFVCSTGKVVGGDVTVVCEAIVVVGASVVGGVVVGATVVGATVVGATVVGATVVGATVVGATVVGVTVVGGVVVGTVEPPVVVGGVVVGVTVVGGAVLPVVGGAVVGGAVVDAGPSTTGIVANVVVGIAQVTAAVRTPFSNVVVVSWKALIVTAPDAGALIFTVTVGVVRRPGGYGPGVFPWYLSGARMLPSYAMFCVGRAGFVGSMLASPDFTTEPSTNVPPPCT
jgi:hypothetical protein